MKLIFRPGKLDLLFRIMRNNIMRNNKSSLRWFAYINELHQPILYQQTLYSRQIYGA